MSKEEKRQPVEYIAKELSLIGNELIQPGQKVSYDGLPGDNLQPTCKIGEARYKEGLVAREERRARARELYPETTGQAGFAKQIAAAITEANAAFAASLPGLISAAIAAEGAKAQTSAETAKDPKAKAETKADAKAKVETKAEPDTKTDAQSMA